MDPIQKEALKGKDQATHTWPYSGKPHPVGEKHRIKDADIHGEETGSIYYRYPKATYKEGK